jgi:hypothetical protein
VGFAGGGNGGQRDGEKRKVGMKSFFTRHGHFLLDIIFLATVFWVARYWHSGYFGLYEDDLTIIPDAFQRSFTSLMGFVYSYIVNLYGHARPLSDSFIYIFSWLGWRIAGLWGPYLIGFVIMTVNIGLFYWLIRRVSDRALALLSGLAFVLYAADTTQAFLTHSLGLQPSALLVLLAIHAYLSNWRVFAYLLAFIVLFSYESPFTLFFAAPLFRPVWNKKLIKELLLHLLILVLMMGGIIVFRSYLGIGRLEDFSATQLLTVPILHMFQGPLVSLGTFALRPIQALQVLNSEIALAIVTGFILLALILWHLDVGPSLRFHELWSRIRAGEPLPASIKMLRRMVITGVVLLMLAYPLTFTVRAYAISGRSTRVHAAGTAGAAILVGCTAYFLLMISRNRWRRAMTLLLASFFALVMGYGFVIQNDYVRAWQLQKQFWAELLPLISDADTGTAILIQPEGIEDVLQIGANTWNLPRVLDQLYVFPPEMIAVPQVYRLLPGWQDRIVLEDGSFQLNQETVRAPPDNYNTFDSRSVIIISTEGGVMKRMVGPLVINAISYPLKPQTNPILPGLPTGVLHSLLLGAAPKPLKP